MKRYARFPLTSCNSKHTNPSLIMNYVVLQFCCHSWWEPRISAPRCVLVGTWRQVHSGRPFHFLAVPSWDEKIDNLWLLQTRQASLMQDRQRGDSISPCVSYPWLKGFGSPASSGWCSGNPLSCFKAGTRLGLDGILPKRTGPTVTSYMWKRHSLALEASQMHEI